MILLGLHHPAALCALKIECVGDRDLLQLGQQLPLDRLAMVVVIARGLRHQHLCLPLALLYQLRCLDRILLAGLGLIKVRDENVLSLRIQREHDLCDRRQVASIERHGDGFACISVIRGRCSVSLGIVDNRCRVDVFTADTVEPAFLLAALQKVFCAVWVYELQSLDMPIPGIRRNHKRLVVLLKAITRDALELQVRVQVAGFGFVPHGLGFFGYPGILDLLRLLGLQFGVFYLFLLFRGEAPRAPILILPNDPLPGVPPLEKPVGIVIKPADIPHVGFELTIDVNVRPAHLRALYDVLMGFEHHSVAFQPGSEISPCAAAERA